MRTMSRFDKAYEQYEKKGGTLSRSKFYKKYVQQYMSVAEILLEEEA